MFDGELCSTSSLDGELCSTLSLFEWLVTSLASFQHFLAEELRSTTASTSGYLSKAMDALETLASSMENLENHKIQNYGNAPT